MTEHFTPSYRLRLKVPKSPIKIHDIEKIDDLIMVEMFDGPTSMGRYKLSHAKLKFK